MSIAIEKMCNIYRGALRLCDIKEDPDGDLVYDTGDNPVKIKISKRTVRLPTEENLKDGGYWVFHPTREGMDKGLSPIMARYIRMLNISLSSKAAALIHSAIQQSSTRPPKARAGKLEALSEIPAAGKKTHSAFIGMVSEAIEAPKIDSWIIKITTKRNSSIGSQKYHRTAKVSMPFFRDHLNGSKKVNKTIDRPCIAKAAAALFPRGYSGDLTVGSNSSQSP